MLLDPELIFPVALAESGTRGRWRKRRSPSLWSGVAGMALERKNPSPDRNRSTTGRQSPLQPALRRPPAPGEVRLIRRVFTPKIARALGMVATPHLRTARPEICWPSMVFWRTTRATRERCGAPSPAPEGTCREPGVFYPQVRKSVCQMN